MPTVYNGVPFRSGGEPVLYLSNPRGVDAAVQRDTLDAVKALNQQRLDLVGDPEIATRINSFEMAYRMQSERAGVDRLCQRAEGDAAKCTAPSRASRRSRTIA